VQGKIRSIELIDREIIGPLSKFCQENWPGAHRIMVLPDHYTLLSDGTHTEHRVPVMIYGTGIEADSARRLTEKEAAKPGRDDYGRSYEFMQHFLHKERFA
jgi:2,3-bisphosphoglycerate-independent phosphoglycerate mutase